MSVLEYVLTVFIERKLLLEELKVHGRSPDYADPIFIEDVRRSGQRSIFGKQLIEVKLGHPHVKPLCI